MAVVTRYVVIRHDREEGVFATQQEADAHDAMLDRAERLGELLEASSDEHGLLPEQIEAVARLLADRTDELLAIFTPAKGAKRTAKPAAPAKPKAEDAPAAEPEGAGLRAVS